MVDVEVSISLPCFASLGKTKNVTAEWRLYAHLNNLRLLFEVRMQMAIGLIATQYRQRHRN